MKNPKLILIGGFLGSGKTTLMMAIGERLAGEGSTVAVVTNDQGEFLVDTAYAQSKGLAAGEVLGGCFCCNFGELTGILECFKDTASPDYILAEPVGSCTDLAATVIGPLALFHKNLVDLGPYLVLADGARLAGEYRDLNLEVPVSPREVLVSHQLREASRIVLSKDDLLTAGERSSAVLRLKNLVPGAEILPCSIPEGTGMSELMDWVKDPTPPALPEPVDIDYKVYAEAEAELGWYNGLCSLSSAIESGTGFSPEDIVLDIITGIKADLGADAAHAKLLIATAEGSLKISLAGGRIQADSAMAPGTATEKAGLTLNIRALRTPEKLEALARRLISEVLERYRLIESNYRSEALIPGEPKPTHRLN